MFCCREHLTQAFERDKADDQSLKAKFLECEAAFNTETSTFLLVSGTVFY